MKRRTLARFCLAFLCLAALAGCTAGPAATTATPDPPPAASPDPVPTAATPEPTPTPTPQPQSLPWEEPELEYISYEEYFGQYRDYDTREDLIFGFPQEGYELLVEDGALLLAQWDTGETLWEICPMDGLEIVLADPSWVYAIRNGKELIRMDYWGNNIQRLFYDESGLISRMNQSDANDPIWGYSEFLSDGTTIRDPIQKWIYLADGRVMCFWAGAENGDGAVLYRLYLSERRVDALFQYTQEELDSQFLFPDLAELEGQGPFYRVSVARPESNQDVSWSTGNPEFFWMADGLFTYEQLTNPEHMGSAELILGLGSRVFWMLDTAAGEVQQKVYGDYVHLEDPLPAGALGGTVLS